MKQTLNSRQKHNLSHHAPPDPDLASVKLGANISCGVFDLKGNDELSNITLVYGSWAFSPDRQTDARFFALYYRDSRKPPRTVKVDNRPIDLRRVDDKKISILTLGGHLLRVVSDQKGKPIFWLGGHGKQEIGVYSSTALSPWQPSSGNNGMSNSNPG